uniref:WGS project CAEQ00000000 data, annotated contig 1446 n=1 Tax=Trypanosoma congolense (strain IL3000) TaxID=1068625 RepID=F9W6B4_TRYCI|nr:unnamed protein product [Trypanosoma congolense IL3000]
MKRLSDEIAALKKQLDSNAQSKGSANAEVKRLSDENAALKRQLDSNAQSKGSANAEMKRLSDENAALKKQLDSNAQSKGSADAEVKRLSDENAALKKQLESNAQSKGSADAEMKRLSDEIAALKKQLDSNAQSKGSANAEVKRLSDENAALKRQLDSNAQSKGSANAEMKRLSDENAALKKQLDSNAQSKGSADAEVKRLSDENAALKKQLKQLSKAKVVVEEKLRGNTSLGGVSSSHGSDGCGHSEKPNVSLSGGSLGFAEDLESSFGLSGIKSECGVAKRHSTAARAPRAVSACEEAARVQGALPEGEFDQLVAEGDDVHPMSGSEWERDVDSDGASTTQPMDDSHIQVLRGLRRIERDVRRCCKVVSQIAPCIKEGRQFKRAMQLAERHSECGDGNYAVQRELNEVAGNYKRRVRKAEQTWMRQWEAVRGLQSRLDDVDEELSRLAEFSSPGPTATPEGGLRPSLKESAAAHDFLVGAHKKVSATLRNVRGVLSEMQRQRRDRHESLFAALQRCSPSVAEAYVQEEGASMGWLGNAAFSASAIGMLCVAMGSMMYKRYELN